MVSMDKRTYSPVVAQDSSRYESIWSSEKGINSAEIVLEEPSAHSCTLKCMVAVSRKCDSAEMSMDIRGHWNHVEDYSFRLFDRNFMGWAIGRLDVVGGPHDNVGMDFPLGKVRVYTPHFHKFDASGFEYAYRTKVIDAHESSIKVDRSFGLKCFLDEENIKYNGQVVLKSNSLLQPSNNEPEDPLKGEDF